MAALGIVAMIVLGIMVLRKPPARTDGLDESRSEATEGPETPSRAKANPGRTKSAGKKPASPRLDR
ncbi:MAG: hypothetical protein EBZ59_07700 [Planctomycetia bacterium]|nr:hypothetical protein [Planctomycetia bacterium]